MASPGKKARLRVMSSAAAVPFTDEPTTTTDDQVYTITDRTKRYWSKNTAVVVERNAVIVPTTEYRLQYAGGKIHFKEAQAPGDTITVTGASVAVTTAAQVREYTLTLGQEIVDVTWLNPALDGFRERMANMHEATGTLSGFYDVNNLLQDKILSQAATVIEMEANDDDDEIFAVYAFLDSNELAAAVEGAVGTTVSWQSDGEILVEQL